MGSPAQQENSTTEMPPSGSQTIDEIDAGSADDGSCSDSGFGVEDPSVVVPGTWENWPSVFASLAGVLHPAPKSQERLRVMTLCSGTDSPVAALEQIIGKENLCHTVSVDAMAASQAFLMANFEPEHVFGDIDCLSKRKTWCAGCRHKCSAVHEPQDLMIMGFPCKAFSTMNPHRWKPEVDPMQCNAAKPFLRFREWLDKNPDPPKVIVLENVAGCLKGSRTRKAPVEFILDGTMVDKRSKLYKYGLNFAERYMVTQMPLQTCDRYGLPLRRRRVFWVMLRRDCFCANDLDNILGKLICINRYRFDVSTPSSFLAPDSDSDSDIATPQQSRKRARVSQGLTKKALQQSYMFRKRHHFPKRHALGGQPFAGSATQEQIAALTERELDVMDCAMLWFTHNKEKQPQDIVVDVSQAVVRLPWKEGRFPSPTTVTKLVLNGNVVQAKVLFRVMGWPRRRLCLPPCLTESQLLTLVGNMISTPVIGGVFLALFAAVQVGPIDIRQAQA